MRKRSVGIVGGGIAGASAARQLAERGHRVTLFEQHPLGHDRGSSHGKSRIVRRAYADSYYTECMQEAYPMWAELERASGEKLLHEVGLIYFGKSDQPNIKSAEEGLIELNVPHTKYSGKGVHEVFPALILGDDETALFTPEAGWVGAERALHATYMLAQEAGAEVREKKASPEDLEPFDRVIITAGAWTKEWWPEAPVVTTLQTFAYLETEIGGPVWIEDSEELLYGCPGDGLGFKVGVHSLGPEIDPSSPDRTPDREAIQTIAAFGKRRLGLEETAVTGAKGCIYTNTDTEDFLLSVLDEKTIIGSACSGHGFKFGPWFGKVLADLVEERTDIACFSRFLA